MKTAQIVIRARVRLVRSFPSLLFSPPHGTAGSTVVARGGPRPLVSLGVTKDRTRVFATENPHAARKDEPGILGCTMDYVGIGTFV